MAHRPSTSTRDRTRNRPTLVSAVFEYNIFQYSCGRDTGSGAVFEYKMSSTLAAGTTGLARHAAAAAAVRSNSAHWYSLEPASR